MISNKVEYDTAAGMYFTTYDFKLPFACQIFLAAR